MRGRYKDYSYDLYSRPEVHLHVGDGRSFIRNSKEQYDVIQMTLVDTWASTAAGAFALSENNLYTVEAFEEYFQHLKPDGFIAITRWEFKEPREALRVVSQGIAALKRIERKDHEELAWNFLVVSDGALDIDGRPVAVLAKRSEFTDAEITAVTEHIEQNGKLTLLYSPRWDACQWTLTKRITVLPDLRGSRCFTSPQWQWRIHSGQPQPYQAHRNAFAGFLAGDIGETINPLTYPYNISPVYDSNPFFFFTLKTGDVFKKILSGTGRGMDWRINLGVTVLFMVFAISVVAVIAFLILPLWLTTARVGAAASAAHRQAMAPAATLLYFLFVGLGFILVEIALIQRFVLFLGHPTYALTVVVFLMLLASGAGSFASRKIVRDSARVWIPLLAIAAGIVLYRFILPAIISTGVGLPFAAKLAISAGLLIPLGFLMGMPFPTGLRAMSERNDTRVEWAWALNAAASVLGSVSAMIIAIHFGLNVTLLCGAAAYVFAIFSRVR
jgi:hypothetical protein